MIKHDFIIITLMLLVSFGLLAGQNAIKTQSDRRYEKIVKAFEQVQNVVDYQQKLIDQYKRDCENITSKVINGEW